MLEENIEQFFILASLTLPGFISKERCIDTETEVYEDYALLVFRLDAPMTVSNLLDVLVDDHDLICCYHMTSHRATDIGERCCVFCQPDRLRMFKINAIAVSDPGDKNRDKCTEIVVTIYESLDIMMADIDSELKRVEAIGKLSYSIPEKDLIASFM
jgi:hypothetical protein